MGKLKVGDTSLNLTIAVGPSSGSDPVQEVTSFGSVALVFDLESGSTLQFVARGNSPEAGYIDQHATDVWLLGDIEARFRAWAVWQEWYQNGQDNVSVLGVTYKKLLNRRLVNAVEGLEFVDTDLGQIIWGLWEHTQSLPGGDLQVTEGPDTTTGIVRTRTYAQGDNLGQAADEEYEEGIWWDIDKDLVYSAGLIDGLPFIDTPIHLGANARGMQRSSANEFANAVYGDASEETTPTWAVDPDVATDPRGRWELAVGWPTVKLQDTLDERVAAALSESVVPAGHWNVEFEPARWVTDSRMMPGDHAVLAVPRSLASPVGEPTESITVMATQVSIGIDADGALTVNAVLQERPNVPVPS